MATTQNALATTDRQDELRKMIRSNEVVAKFSEIMRKQDAMSYISGVLLTVANSPSLQECTPTSIIVAAMRAATLRLSCDPATGQAYLVPFKDHGTPKATLVIGYRGLEQMALRTGKYRTINVFPVYEGQEYVENQMTGRADIIGHRKAGGRNVIGYGLYFELIPNFQKSFYMTCEEILEHAARYSKTFNNNTSLWKTEPEKMMRKTVMRLGLSRYGYIDPFDRMTMEQVDEAEVTEDDEDQIEGSYTENETETVPEIEETSAEKEARIISELTGEPAPAAPSKPAVVDPATANTASAPIEPGKMSLEMAGTVKNKEGEFYKDMPMDQLAFRHKTLSKIPKGERTPEQQFKIDALEVLIQHKGQVQP
jgi:recombination protein RecT